MLKDSQRILCACTVGNPGFSQLLELAGSAGFQGLSIWLPYVEEQLQAGYTLEGMKKKADEAGIVIAQVEAVSLWSEGVAHSSNARVEEQKLFEIAVELGASTVLAVNLQQAGTLADMQEGFNALCHHAAEYSLACALEFLPWTAIPDLATARKILSAADGANAGLVIDSWHVFRSGVALADIAALSPDDISSIQLSDCPVVLEGPSSVEETLSQRVMPGDGVLDLKALVNVLNQLGVTVPVAVETMNLELADQAESLAAQAGNSLVALLSNEQ